MQSQRFSVYYATATPKSQKQKVLEYLQNQIATSTMIAGATGIPQKNICRYKRELEKKQHLRELYKDHCKVTGRLAWYLVAAEF